MSESFDLDYWRNVKTLSVDQAAMLFADEIPPKSVEAPIEGELSDDFLRYQKQLGKAVKQYILPAERPCYYGCEVEIDDKFLTYDEVNTQKTIIEREELAIWAFNNRYSPSFLQYELENIDEIKANREASKVSEKERKLNELAVKFLDASKEILLLKSKCRRLKPDEKKLEFAKQQFLQNPTRFQYVKEQYITLNWFDSSHGTRESQGIVFTGIAKEAGVLISAESARRIFKAKQDSQSIPDVPIKDCLPDQ
ncbi:MAG: hypothetical protein HGB26_05570 [Desulfobulbaceae bacterium]|nr:hypothetical protein [Desulfobulbaceae bacterium]